MDENNSSFPLKHGKPVINLIVKRFKTRQLRGNASRHFVSRTHERGVTSLLGSPLGTLEAEWMPANSGESPDKTIGGEFEGPREPLKSNPLT